MYIESWLKFILFVIHVGILLYIFIQYALGYVLTIRLYNTPKIFFKVIPI